MRERLFFPLPGIVTQSVGKAGCGKQGKPLKKASFHLIEETLTDPYEVWMGFEQSKKTGQVVLRQRIIKAVSIGKKEGFVFVSNARNGILEGWTFVPAKNQNYLQNQRYGELVYGRGTLPSDQGGDE